MTMFGRIDHGGLVGLADDDHTQYHNTTRADAWLATKEESTFPGSANVTYGTLISGTYSDLVSVNGTDLVVEEVTSADALQINMGFADVSLAPTQLTFYGHYDGSNSHRIAVEIFNVNTTTWEEIGVITHGTADAWYVMPIYLGTNYISGADNVLVRFRHIQSGVAGHTLYLDYVVLQHTLSTGGGTGVVEHGILEGLTDDDHSQYALLASTRGAQTFVGTVNFGDALLGVADTNASHYLRLDCGSDLSADRILSLVTGDAARTITLSGNPTLADWFDQSVKTGSGPSFNHVHAYLYGNVEEETAGTGLTLKSTAWVKASAPYVYMSDSNSTRPQLKLANSTQSSTADQLCGKITFTKYSGTNAPYQYPDAHAEITAHTDAATGDNDAPGRLGFWTTPDGSTTLAERMRINKDGRIVIGTALTDGIVGAAGATETWTMQIKGYESSTSANWNGLLLNAAGYAPVLTFAYADGTIASPTLSDNNDLIGTIEFLGFDGSHYHPSANIKAEHDGTTGSDDLPGRLIFSTAADGAITCTERLRIHSTGAITTPDGDYTCIFGRTAIGYGGGYGDYAYFGHRDLYGSAGQYAVLQSNDGTSFFNSASGKSMYFRVNNTTEWEIDSSGHLKGSSGNYIYLGGQTTYYMSWNSGNTAYDTNANLMSYDHWLGVRSVWLSNYLNQAVLTTSAPTFSGGVYTAAVFGDDLTFYRASTSHNTTKIASPSSSYVSQLSLINGSNGGAGALSCRNAYDATNYRTSIYTSYNGSAWHETAFYGDSTYGGNMYVPHNCSVESLTDRTSMPKDSKEAYYLLSTMKAKYKGKDKDGVDDYGVDYDVLDPKLKKIQKVKPDSHAGPDVAFTEEQMVDEPGRDLTLTVSCLVEVVNDLTARLKAIGG